jgi:hypothetical protein
MKRRLFGLNAFKLASVGLIFVWGVLIAHAAVNGYWSLVYREFDDSRHMAAVFRQIDAEKISWTQYQTRERQKCEALIPQCIADHRSSTLGSVFMFFEHNCQCSKNFYPDAFDDLRSIDGVYGISHRLLEVAQTAVASLLAIIAVVFILPPSVIGFLSWIRK